MKIQLRASNAKRQFQGGADHCTGNEVTYSDTWSFSLATRKWQQLATHSTLLPGPRWGHFVWVDDRWNPDVLLVFGGRNQSEYVARAPWTDVWALDIVREQWRKLADGIPGREDGTYSVANSAFALHPNTMRDSLDLYFTNSYRLDTGPALRTVVWRFETRTATFHRFGAQSAFRPAQNWYASLVNVAHWNNTSARPELLVLGGDAKQLFLFNASSLEFVDYSQRGLLPPLDCFGHVAVAGALAASPFAPTTAWHYAVNDDDSLYAFDVQRRSWSIIDLSTTTPRPHARPYSAVVTPTAGPTIVNGPPGTPILFIVGGHLFPEDVCVSDIWMLSN